MIRAKKAGKGRSDMKPLNLKQRVGQLIGVLLCVLFGSLLLANVAIIVEGTMDPDRPPSLFGLTPMVVMSGSMKGTIDVGDMIFVDNSPVETVKQGDIISFLENKTVVTHRVISVTKDDKGRPLFETKGDANNEADALPVKSQHYIGKYRWRIPKLGDFALFLQTPMGMILFMGVPILGFILYDVLRRQKDKKHVQDLEDELARLKNEAESLRSNKEDV